MKNKTKNEKLQPKLRLISIIDGLVDFSLFEITIYKTNNRCKVIRAANEEVNQKIRPAYRGPY